MICARDGNPRERISNCPSKSASRVRHAILCLALFYQILCTYTLRPCSTAAYLVPSKQRTLPSPVTRKQSSTVQHRSRAGKPTTQALTGLRSASPVSMVQGSACQVHVGTSSLWEYNTIQYSTIQCNAMQYYTKLYVLDFTRLHIFRRLRNLMVCP